ncbi:MAG: 4Fe-4S dicluster domain-containing protein [Anaerolineales bacterium]|nr:4Fe-4S dicluster domain-containing protein [Anaerolineales bacterium]
MSKRYGMAIDLDKCVACHSCTIACKQENDIAPRTEDEPGTQGPRWNWVYEVGPFGTFPDLEGYWLPKPCQHCEDPQCLAVCPTGATFKREDGIVLVDRDRCIGCQYCIMACPYDVRSFEEDTGVISKCTFCSHRVDVGLEPSCVHHCIGRARIFGDLNDPNSEVSKLIKESGDKVYTLRPELGTKPSVHYILRKQPWRG